jgi:hypothetical protein
VIDYGEDETFFTVPRLEPATPFYSEEVSKHPQRLGPNTFNGLNVPLPKSFTPLSSTLGISDFGPFPSDMMHPTRSAVQAHGMSTHRCIRRSPSPSAWESSSPPTASMS